MQRMRPAVFCGLLLRVPFLRREHGEIEMTFDIYTNRSQWAMLTDEEKAAMLAHQKAGGDIEYRGIDGEWRSRQDQKAILSEQTVYRAKRRPIECWVTVHKSGASFVYREERLARGRAAMTASHDHVLRVIRMTPAPGPGGE